MKKEAVNSPAHYGGKDNPHEHVKCAEAWGLVENAFLYNATKYLYRADKKENRIQDIEKAIWYLQREIKRLKSQETQTK